MYDKDIMGKLHKGEPFFIIRAQDKHSPAILKLYASLVDSNGNRKLASRVFNIADEFSDWQDVNKHMVKNPD